MLRAWLVSVLAMAIVLVGCTRVPAPQKRPSAEPAEKPDAKPAPAPVGAAPQPPRKGATIKGRLALLIAKPDAEPAIDGKLDDACWQKAEPVAFRLLDGSADRPKRATVAKLLATDKTLFIAIQCAETEQLVSRKRDRDDNVWEDDSVELFIKPGAEATREYYHLAVNPDGSFYDDFARDTAAWQSQLKLATAKGKEGWTIELAIPLAELNLPKDKAAAAGPWRLNLTRTRQQRGDDVPAEETALSPTENRSSHVPAMFAYAFLEAFGGKLPAE
jgi:hypothetical protein